MSQVFSIAWIVLLFAVFYFLIIRPQQQRAKRHQKLLSNLKVGDNVETVGGIHGKIISLNQDSLELEIAPKVVVNISQRAVSATEKKKIKG